MKSLLRDRSTGETALASLVILAAIGIVDFFTGEELSISFFYLVPVSLAVWHISRRAGILVAVLAGLLWTFIAYVSRPIPLHPLIQIWNGALQTGTFVAFAMVLWMVRSDLIRQRKLNAELEQTLSQIKTLKGLLPICSSCKSIRNDKGYWERIEKYIGEHTEAEFTHGICPDCIKKLYPDYKGP